MFDEYNVHRTHIGWIPGQSINAQHKCMPNDDWSHSSRSGYVATSKREREWKKCSFTLAKWNLSSSKTNLNKNNQQQQRLTNANQNFPSHFHAQSFTSLFLWEFKHTLCRIQYTSVFDHVTINSCGHTMFRRCRCCCCFGCNPNQIHFDKHFIKIFTAL